MTLEEKPTEVELAEWEQAEAEYAEEQVEISNHFQIFERRTS